MWNSAAKSSDLRISYCLSWEPIGNGSYLLGYVGERWDFSLLFFFCYLFLYIYLFGCAGLSCGRWDFSCDMWDLAPQTGIKPGPHALGAPSFLALDHQEVPGLMFLHVLTKYLTATHWFDWWSWVLLFLTALWE